MKMRFIIYAVLLFLPLLAGCTSDAGAADAVEAYLQAVVNKDHAQASSLACADWEQDALLEVDSFEAVEPALQGMSCEASGMDGDYTVVKCTGVIAVTYNNEQQEIRLDSMPYLAIQEGGDWRMCGYQQ